MTARFLRCHRPISAYHKNYFRGKRLIYSNLYVSGCPRITKVFCGAVFPCFTNHIMIINIKFNHEKSPRKAREDIRTDGVLSSQRHNLMSFFEMQLALF